MNLYLFGICSVVVSTLLAVGGMLFVRKRVGVATLVKYHEVAGYLLSVVGTLYAVLLGFVVVDAMQHTQEIRVLVDQEASSLANIYLCANGLPSDKKFTIQKLCDDYAGAVVDEEWQTMQHNKYSPRTFGIVWKLWKEVSTYSPETEREKTLHQQIVSEICDMTENHRTRIVSASHGMNPLMWTVLIVGGVFTVMFTYFFGVENVNAQVIMTVLVALTLSLNVLLVFVFGNPFGGECAVQPDSFKLDRMIFKHFDSGAPPSL